MSRGTSHTGSASLLSYMLALAGRIHVARLHHLLYMFCATWIRAVCAQELEYPDGHTSRSIYVGMPLESLGENVSAAAREHLQGASLAIWTTTPWTIPANGAVAVNADLLYCIAAAEVGFADPRLYPSFLYAGNLLNQ